MGTITGIGDLDPARWPNSHWRSVKVGWDESTAGERQPRVSLWEIEPLTTFPMYPSLFPLRLKRPWYPGASSFQDGRDDTVNGMAWLRGETAEQALHSLNFQSSGMLPWMHQRVDPSFLQSNLNQHYLAASMQNAGSADALKQQLLQFQQPLQQLQHSGTQSTPQLFVHGQTQTLDTFSRPMQPQVNNQESQQHGQHLSSYPETYLMQSQQQSFPKTDFMESSSKFSSNIAPTMQNMLGSALCSEGTSNLSNFSRTAQPVVAEHQSNQQSWVSRFNQPQVNAASTSPSVDQESSSLEAQNHGIYSGINVDSSGLLLPTMDTDLSTIPSPFGGYMQESSELLQPNHNRTFVKVYKSGCVGRSLDISRFNSYNELRRELGQMFGIEGLLEDPQRSGWQLVFVDRENDVLLLGDDPWEAFVNSVWYIKILSPEDVQQLGKH
ncbi:hypothetical protein M8C21_003005, partial [Ambrosia artemisiifolia]